MMRGFQQYLNLCGLIAAIAFALFTRGACLRIYWLPVAIILALLAAGLFLSINMKIIPANFNLKVDVPLLWFLSWAGLSIAASINREQSVFEASRLAVFVMVYFIAAYGLPENGGKKALLAAVVVMGFAEAAYGTTEFILQKPLLNLDWVDVPRSFERVNATLVNHNHFAGLMEMSIFAGLGLIVAAGARDEPRSEQTAKRMMIAIPCGIMLLALMLSLSRGGWSSFIAGGVFFAAVSLWNRHPAGSRVIAAAVVIMLITGALIMSINRKPLLKRFQSIETLYQEPQQLTNNARISIYKSTIDMIADRPLTGTGLGTYRSAYPSYRRDNFFRGVVFAHNDYLQIASTTGLPGLLFFLIFAAMLLRHGFRTVKSSRSAFTAGTTPGVMAAVFAILVHETVDFNLMISSNAMIFFALAGIIAGGDAEDR